MPLIVTYLIELDKSLGPSDLGYFGGMQPHSTQHDHDDFHHIATDHKELYSYRQPCRYIAGNPRRHSLRRSNEIDKPTVATIIKKSFNCSETHCNRRDHNRRPTKTKTIAKRTDWTAISIFPKVLWPREWTSVSEGGAMREKLTPENFLGRKDVFFLFSWTTCAKYVLRTLRHENIGA